MDEIWKTTEIPSSKQGYIECLKSLTEKTNNTYDTLSDHLEKTNLEKPSEISTIISLFDQFDKINTKADRILLNLFIYINAIRVNHLSCDLQTCHVESINSLLQIISEQRRSLQTTDYTSFLEAYNEQKDKSTDLYYPCLAILERRIFKTLLNGLMGILMICNFITKQLEHHDILESLDISIRSNTNNSYF